MLFCHLEAKYQSPNALIRYFEPVTNAENEKGYNSSTANSTTVVPQRNKFAKKIF